MPLSARAPLLPDPRHAIGIITPSGNTVVERVTIGILHAYPEVSCHFSRTVVTGSIDGYTDGYDWDSMLGAARLLSHARPNLIVWNGSKAGSIAFDLDHELVRRVTSETQVRATTSTLALIEVLRATGARRLGLVSPYTAKYQKKILETFEREGFPIIADACAGLSDNLSYASVPSKDIRRMTCKVASEAPDAIIAWCTNFLAAPIAADLEAETGIPFYDSTALAVWHPLTLLGLDTRRASAWGSLFSGRLGA